MNHDLSGRVGSVLLRFDPRLHPLKDGYMACTGCAACAAICPSSAIRMRPDSEGFSQPCADSESCSDCGLCRETCPVARRTVAEGEIALVQDRLPEIGVYAAWNLDEEVRRSSSSGGVFSVLAEQILARDGCIVGAVFDENLVVKHVVVNTVKGLTRLRGSKYVQSDLSPTVYHQVRWALLQKKTVLFSGTPCQVAGLRTYLHHPFENLFCCDLVCHGVPSPRLLDEYIRYSQNDRTLIGIDFRHKASGWKQFRVRHSYSDSLARSVGIWSDPFMHAFLRDYCLRECCYSCQYSTLSRVGDLTIGDFWSVERRYPEYDRDDRGTSLVLVNTDKGRAWLEASRSSLFVGPADLETALKGNPLLAPRSGKQPLQRLSFYRDLDLIGYEKVIKKYRLHPTSLSRRVIRGVWNRALRLCQLLETREKTHPR